MTKINKGHFAISKWDLYKFSFKRGKGHFLSFIKNRIIWHYFARFHILTKFPDHVDIEISSICNLHCPMCYTITKEFRKKVKTGLMDFDLYKKIIDECVKYKTFSIRLSLRGEPFLHPKIVEMVKYAKKKGIKEVSTLTNGLRLDSKMFEEMIDAGMDWITISFDGLGKTYENIRRPAKFKEALAKIKKYHEIKKERGVVKPVVKVQSIWPAIEKNPSKYYETFKPITDMIATNPIIDYLRNDKDIEYEEDFTCPVLWQRMTIGSDGMVLLCSNDERGGFIIGDANKKSLYRIWHGKKMRYARRVHKKKIGFKKIEPCKDCYYPRKTRSTVKLVNGKMVRLENYVNRTQEIGK